MILKNKKAVMKRVNEIVSEYIDTRDFGEYGVTVTIHKGRIVKLNRIDREHVINYGSETVAEEE